ncbi:MAG: MFS transporter [Bifidobacteriaceae bacterium]|jgi:MFS family permease|nr:MFS transporter [Bifidobacteriaceae bacterium]
MKVLLKNKPYRYLFFSNQLSVICAGFYYIALITLADTLPNPKIGVLMISVLSQIPIFLNFILGIIADKSKDRFKGIISNSIFATVIFLIISFLVVFASGNYILFSIIVALYCVSSLLDYYTTYLKVPFLPLIVKKDDYQEAIGVNQAFKQTMTFLANAIGAVFILWFSFQNIALINSGLIICSLLLFLAVSKSIKSKTENKLPKPDLSKKIFSKGTIKDIKELFEIKEVFYAIVSATFINSIFATGFTLIIMHLVADSSFALISYQFSIVSIEGVEFAGVVLGGLIGIIVFKKMSIKGIINIVFAGAFIWFGAFFIDNFIALIIVSFLVAFFTAIVSAKSTTVAFEKIAPEKLSTISGIAFTFGNIATPVLILIFSSLAVMLHMRLVIIILTAFTLICFLFLLVYSRKTEFK